MFVSERWLSESAWTSNSDDRVGIDNNTNTYTLRILICHLFPYGLRSVCSRGVMGLSQTNSLSTDTHFKPQLYRTISVNDVALTWMAASSFKSCWTHSESFIFRKPFPGTGNLERAQCFFSIYIGRNTWSRQMVKGSKRPDVASTKLDWPIQKSVCSPAIDFWIKPLVHSIRTSIKGRRIKKFRLWKSWVRWRRTLVDIIEMQTFHIFYWRTLYLRDLANLAGHWYALFQRYLLYYSHVASIEQLEGAFQFRPN